MSKFDVRGLSVEQWKRSVNIENIPAIVITGMREMRVLCGNGVQPDRT